MLEKKLVVHLGLPKCGSSFIQAYLDLAMPHLRERDVAVFIPRETRNSETIKRLTNRFGRGYSVHHLVNDAVRLRRFRRYVEDSVLGRSENLRHVQDTVRKEVSDLVGRTRESVIWISDEAIFHYLMPTYTMSQCEDYIPYVIKVIEAAFGDWRPTVILVVRRQDTYIESSYYQWVRLHGMPLGFGHYLAKDVKLARLDWFDLAERLAAAYGHDHVRVIPFETVYVSPRTYISEILGSSGLNGDLDEDALAQAAANSYPAPSAWAIRLMRLAGVLSWNWATFNKRAAWIERHFPRGRYVKAQALAERESLRILEIMACSNERLFDSYLTNYENFRGYYMGRDSLPGRSLDD